MPGTRGIHVIWTTYGTWLPGDPCKAGHWSPLFDLYGRVCARGGRVNLPDATTFMRVRELANDPVKVLADEEISIVAAVLGDLIGSAPGKPGAMCYAAAIEPTHVHMLLASVREDIGRFVGRLKGMTSSALRRHPDNWNRKRLWTAKYWKVFLFDDETAVAVQRYVEDHNTRRGKPAAPYAWITPRI